MDSFEFRSLKADDPNLGRNHKCGTVDFARGYVCHRDCSDCGAVVFVEQTDSGHNDFDVPLDEGARCFDCKEVSCSDCIHTLTPDGKPRCPVCYERVRIQAQSGDELFDAPGRALEALEAYSKALASEQNPARIRESIGNLNRLEDMFARVNAELLPNIERALGKQQTLLPRGNAA